MSKNMKTVLLLLSCAALWFVLATFFHDICRFGGISFLVALVGSGGLFYYIYTQKLNAIDSHYYGQAEQEVTNKIIDEGLWAKALVNVKGNESLRKVEYIKLRAQQLQKEQVV